MLWFIMILFAVLSIVLLTGKGAFLIAGYNTAGETERSQYNEKLLCRVMGGGMSVFTVLIALDAFSGGGFSSTLGGVHPVLIAVTIVVMLVLSNTICRKKNSPEILIVNMESAKRRRLFSGIFTGVILVLATALFFTGKVKANPEEDILKIQCSYWPGIEIPYDNIESLSLMEGLDKGARTNGLGTYRISAGKWQNAEFGSYRLYANARCKTYIVMEVKKEIIVINAEDEKSTQSLLTKIKEKSPL